MVIIRRLNNPPDARRSVDLLIEAVGVKVRDSFADFRRFRRCLGLVDARHGRAAAAILDLRSGRRPKLAPMAPPQHGKSSIATEFIAWVAGRNSDLKTIFASYSDELGIRTNLAIQRLMKDPRYAAAFARTQVELSGWQCNKHSIEYAHHAGSFHNTTVPGAVTGLQLDLGVVDEPVKGRQEVNSRLNRDRIWNWFTDDFLTRFAAYAALLMIMTRWHVDDPVGSGAREIF